MKHNKTLLYIGLIEICIGGITLLAVTISLIFSTNTKTPNVLWFVLITSSISSLLGIGLLIFNRLAYKLLIYFSSVIILSKILILADIIQLNGTLETTVSSPFKNLISIFYHLFVIIYLSKRNIRELFIKQT